MNSRMLSGSMSPTGGVTGLPSAPVRVKNAAKDLRSMA